MGYVIMSKIKELVTSEKLQYLIFVILSISVTMMTWIISNLPLFERYFGKINPLIIIISTSILGVILLSLLLAKGQFLIYKKGNINGILLSAGLAALFAAVIILVDIKVVFPNDIDVLFPQSLLFYPAIGFIVEVLFHILPMSLLFFLLSTFFKRISNRLIIWICILTVSILEPVYQTISFIGHYPSWTVFYIGFHILLINLVQLLIFKRYDFISMYLFRLVYYLIWHIIWGYMRLELLF
jgi:hypothetical protein